MSNGWVKLHRTFIESDLWLSAQFTKGQAWVDLFSLANHKDNTIWIRGIEIKVKRGQLAWSEVSLSKRWKWSRNKTRRFLKWLKTEQQIEQQNNNVTTLITITNYHMYQKHDTLNGTPSDTPKGQQKDTKRYTNKNDKKEKKGKNSIYTPNFLIFWEAYPKKEGKGAAFKSYKNILLPKPTLKEILSSLEIIKKSEQWQTKKYIPNPATWLNQRRWEDEIDTPITTPPKKETFEELEEEVRRAML